MEENDKRLKNLKPFKKGETGNPNGRPKGSKNRSTIALELLETILKKQDPLNPDSDRQEFTAEELMVAEMMKQAMGGDVAAFKAVMDSAYGTPKQTVETTTIDVTPPKVRFIDKDKD